MIRIKNVEYLNKYKLKILFSDGKSKIIDFENWINEGGAYVLPLRDIDYFKKVHMDEFNYTICWPNGADFCPDVLYETGKDIQEQPRRVGQRKKTGEKSQFKYQSIAIAKKVSRKSKS